MEGPEYPGGGQITMLSTASPFYLVMLVNTGAWFALHMAGAWLAYRLPLERFRYEDRLYKTRRWEQEGLIYRKLFNVRLWKKYLPDGAAMFKGGFPKKHILPNREADYYEEFLKETCRAELTHWIVMLTASLFFLWNDWVIAVFMIPYAVISNAPCIIVQRYNRPRIVRYSAILKEGETD